MSEKQVIKKSGRFIKKGDPLRAVVAISDFPLQEISETPVAFPDNPIGSIISRALHVGTDAEMGVRASGDVFKEFDADNRRPIIRPMDFTEDWKRQKQRQSSRRGKADEEEEFELELELLSKKKPEESRPIAETEAQDLADTPENESPSTPVESSPIQEVAAAMQTAPADTFFKIQRDSMDSLSKAINQESDPTAEAVAAAVDRREEEKQFVPLKASLNPSMESPEREAIRHYQESLVDREKIMEEARAEGYQEGFRVGEEKAALQTKKQLAELTQELTNILAELEGFKKNVLLNSQENFQVLCQALMEALLRREFEVNPGSFTAIVERALQEAVPDDQFKIHVNPETYETVQRFFGESLKSKVVANKVVPKGDFRIESNLTVVDGNISQLIRDLLDQADLSLFSAKGRAS